MRWLLRIVVAGSVLGVLACGEDDNGDARELRTTDAGTVIIGAADDKAGLEVEIQDDSLYVRLTDDAPGAARKLAGKPLGGACEVDGRGGVRVARQFPIYWRQDPGDWGSAVVREPIGASGRDNLAQHVVGCRIFAPKPTGTQGQLSFNEATDAPFATVRFR